jgi:catechol 2,3-dioxygenase-like lactoylglutathione lyase family enzyme
MIDHTGVGVADVERSAIFYDAALEALGMRRVRQMPENVGSDGIGYGIEYPVFWIDRYHPHSVKQHTAFAAKNRAEVEAFHAAALKAGGTENGAPGLRRENYHAAFVLYAMVHRSRTGTCPPAWPKSA